jgi:hypothetical protein
MDRLLNSAVCSCSHGIPQVTTVGDIATATQICALPSVITSLICVFRIIFLVIKKIAMPCSLQDQVFSRARARHLHRRLDSPGRHKFSFVIIVASPKGRNITRESQVRYRMRSCIIT